MRAMDTNHKSLHDISATETVRYLDLVFFRSTDILHTDHSSKFLARRKRHAVHHSYRKHRLQRRETRYSPEYY